MIAFTAACFSYGAGFRRLSQNSESRKNGAAVLVPRLRLHCRPECQVVTGQSPEDMGSQAAPGNQKTSR